MTRSRNTPASPKEPLIPDVTAMEDRAARAWTEPMAVTPLGDGLYEVDSGSGAAYVVDLPDGRCSCPDSVYRRERCKHLRRTAIEINEGRVPPPGRQAAVCAACGDRTFVDEDADPPALCGDCVLEPGDPVTDRETGDLLVVEAVTDRRADEVEIPDAGCTVADYPTNREYDPADPVVEAAYPFSGERRYSFPISRLERRSRATPRRSAGS